VLLVANNLHLISFTFGNVFARFIYHCLGECNMSTDKRTEANQRASKASCNCGVMREVGGGGVILCVQKKRRQQEGM
jgi:hypothetical protein